MKLAKKKFGDLNTNEANKWLVDKYNALLGKENTKNIANKIQNGEGALDDNETLIMMIDQLVEEKT